MDKWDYIKIIKSYEKSKRGYLLLGLLDRYDKNGLIDITDKEAKEYCEELTKDYGGKGIEYA